MSKPSLVVVGGGYIGLELSQNLAETFDVTLVEPRKHFVHTPAMLRALVDEDVQNRALIPYDKALKKGQLVAARAVEVKENQVILDNGNVLSADYIVLCTGASNGAIFKPGDETVETFRLTQAKVAGEIRAASSIVIVGAGAVGTELAGEIAHAHPEKTLTLISSDQTLFPDFPRKLGARLTQKLTSAGVEVVTGLRVTDLESTAHPYKGTATLSDGRSITADLIIPAIGSRPQTALFNTLPGVVMGQDGRVKVDRYLRPSTLPNVFAAGDAVDAGDMMTIVATSRQQPWLAKLLKAVAAGKSIESQKAYTPWGKAPILIPLGPDIGHSFLIFTTAGDWVTRSMKGRDLFITKYRKLLGYG